MSKAGPSSAAACTCRTTRKQSYARLMPLFTLTPPPPMVDPVMVMGLAGWGDAASAASDAADWLGEDGQPIVAFDGDSIFDYRSNRPVLRLSGGEVESLTWPKMEIVHVRPQGVDVLVMVGNEPDFGWGAISDSLADLVGHLGVSKLVTLGAVPTPVRHTPEATVFCTASEPRLLLSSDEMLVDEIAVPASAGTVFRAAIEDTGVPCDRILGTGASVHRKALSPCDSRFAAQVCRPARCGVRPVRDGGGLARTDRPARRDTGKTGRCTRVRRGTRESAWATRRSSLMISRRPTRLQTRSPSSSGTPRATRPEARFSGPTELGRLDCRGQLLRIPTNSVRTINAAVTAIIAHTDHVRPFTALI